MNANDVGPSPDVLRVFDALRRRKNALITGAPSTGKTRLLSQVARWFEEAPGVGFAAEGVPFPPRQVGRGGCRALDGRIVSHSGWPFIPGLDIGIFSAGLEPIPGVSSSFRYSKGMLYLANEHALGEEGAALLIIDEINRGPAVESFGDTIVSLEADKRLDEDDEHRIEILPNSASRLTQGN